MTQKYKYVFNKTKDNIISNVQGFAEKYNHAGIYSISIGDKLVYIGKSENMMKRIIEHIIEIKRDTPREYKYKILKQATNHNQKIKFDVLYYSINQDHYNIENDIGKKEGEFIRKFLPPLNYQIPREDNYKKFTINKKATTVTLEEILEKENSYE